MPKYCVHTTDNQGEIYFLSSSKVISEEWGFLLEDTISSNNKYEAIIFESINDTLIWWIEHIFKYFENIGNEEPWLSPNLINNNIFVGCDSKPKIIQISFDYIFCLKQINKTGESLTADQRTKLSIIFENKAKLQEACDRICGREGNNKDKQLYKQIAESIKYNLPLDFLDHYDEPRKK